MPSSPATNLPTALVLFRSLFTLHSSSRSDRTKRNYFLLLFLLTLLAPRFSLPAPRYSLPAEGKSKASPQRRGIVRSRRGHGGKQRVNNGSAPVWRCGDAPCNAGQSPRAPSSRPGATWHTAENCKSIASLSVLCDSVVRTSWLFLTGL